MGPSWPGRTSGFRRALHPSRARPRAGRPDGTREIRTLRGRDPDECCGSRRGSRIGSDAAGGPNGRAGDRVRSVAPDRRDPSPPPSDLPARLPTVGRAMSVGSRPAAAVGPVEAGREMDDSLLAVSGPRRADERVRRTIGRQHSWSPAGGVATQSGLVPPESQRVGWIAGPQLPVTSSASFTGRLVKLYRRLGLRR